MNIATDAEGCKGRRSGSREKRNGAQTAPAPAPSPNDENASSQPDEEAIVIKDVSQFFC